jgi:hypothetical protein
MTLGRNPSVRSQCAGALECLDGAETRGLPRRWLVVEHRFNRAWYESLVGQILTIRPAYALVQEVVQPPGDAQP